MLDALRQGAQSWVSKLLMLLLVVSFGIWGVAGRLVESGSGSLAKVGGEEVSMRDFAQTLERVQRSGQQVSPEQVLNAMMLNAALSDEARGYNLGLSEDRLAKQISDDPRFKTKDGVFDRDLFTAILANSGIDRNDYVRQLRADAVRDQIASSAASGLAVPQPLVEALYRYRNEERTVSFVTVGANAITPVGTPYDKALADYFDANKEQFRAPELRKLGLLVLDPAKLADPKSVTDAEIAAEYKTRLDSFTRPERRHVQQVTFATKEAAEQALAKTKTGTTLAQLADEEKQTATFDQGMKTKAEVLDPAVADAAFAATANTVVAVTDKAVQPSLVQVTEIEAGAVTPQAEVAERLRTDIATRKARDRVQDTYDKIEDERAGGSTLEEIGKSQSLPYRTVEVDRSGKAADGTAVTDLPTQAQLLPAAFDSDVGVENNAIRGGDDTFTFYEVLNVTAAHDRKLDEVKPAVISAWQAEETRNRIADRAEALLGRLQKGEALAAIATEIGATASTVEHVKRDEPPPQGLSANAAAQAFAGPQGHVADADSDAPPNRILLKVDAVTVPAFFADAADSKAISGQLAQQLRNDLLQTYNRQLLEARTTSVNQQAFAQISGTQRTQ